MNVPYRVLLERVVVDSEGILNNSSLSSWREGVAQVLVINVRKE